MATQLAPQRTSAAQSAPEIRKLDDASTADVRAFARHYVSVLLELEGVRVTPATIADAQL
jgi:hypothetical protein